MLFQKLHWLLYKQFCVKRYKRIIALSGLLVCRLIKSLTETLSSKLSHSPSKLRFSVKFSRTFSVYIPATRRVFFTKYIQIHIYVSDSFFQYQEGKYLALYPLSTNPAGDIFKQCNEQIRQRYAKSYRKYSFLASRSIVTIGPRTETFIATFPA